MLASITHKSLVYTDNPKKRANEECESSSNKIEKQKYKIMNYYFFGKTTKCYIITCYVILVPSYMQIYGRAVNLPNSNKMPALIVFGDSIVDPGNNNYINTLAKVNFPPYGRDFDGGVATGRYSNGKIPSDLLAEEMGIKELVPPYLDPNLQINDLLTGVSFASGGAGYDPTTAKIGNALSLEDQLKMFKEYVNKLKAAVGDEMTSTIISKSVYLVCAGSNDITNTYFALPFRRSHYDVPSYTSLMVGWASTFVQELYNMGARRIGLINAPPCGCLPSQRTLQGGLLRSCVHKENQASIIYNNKLNLELNSLNRKLIGSLIVYLDIYTPLMNLVTNPSQSGFEVSNRGCCGIGILEAGFLCSELDIGTCSDASRFVFWDSFHPSQAAYKVIVHSIVQKNRDLFF